MTDKPMPRLVRKRPPPPPEAETIQHGSVSPAVNRDPLRPIDSDTTTRWLSARQASALIGSAISDPVAAENEIINLALSGLVRLSCEALNVQTLGGEIIFTAKRPGDDAKLAKRINKARKSDNSGFIFKSESSFITWVDLANRVRVNVHRLLVDADSVTAFFAAEISGVDEATPPRSDDSEPEFLQSVKKGTETAREQTEARMDIPRSDRSGGAGRPTSMHLIEGLMKGRAERGELSYTLAAEADALLRMFIEDPANAGLARPSVKTISNKLRHLYRELTGKGPE